MIWNNNIIIKTIIKIEEVRWVYDHAKARKVLLDTCTCPFSTSTRSGERTFDRLSGHRIDVSINIGIKKQS